MFRSRALTTAVAAGCVVGLTGCQATDDSSGPATGPACAQVHETELGLPTLDVPATFTTSGGRLRFRVTGMSPDALIPIDSTTVFLGDAATLPHRDPDRTEWPDNATYWVRVSLDREGYVDVAAGSYWLVSSAGGRVFAGSCPGTTISGVTRIG